MQFSDQNRSPKASPPRSDSETQGVDFGLSEFLTSTKANVDWLGYMSSTGVYGDRGGGWVNEDSLLDTKTIQGQARVVAEKKWKEPTYPLGFFTNRSETMTNRRC